MIIELHITPFGIPIAFETTGIIVKSTGNKNAPAVVNGISVKEKYNEIIEMLKNEEEYNNSDSNNDTISYYYKFDNDVFDMRY